MVVPCRGGFANRPYMPLPEDGIGVLCIRFSPHRMILAVVATLGVLCAGCDVPTCATLQRAPSSQASASLLDDRFIGALHFCVPDFLQ